jgi:hypothetical protein
MEDLIGRSFTAQLMCRCEAGRGAIQLSPDAGVARGGWLLLSSNPESASRLRFAYQGEAEGRFLYAITGTDESAAYAGAALGISTSGFLGLYNIASVTNRWKIEVTAQAHAGRPARFWLRSAAGERVALINSERKSGQRYGAQYCAGGKSIYLNVRRGSIVEFMLRDAILSD